MDLIELKSQRILSAPEFVRFADVPPEAQWFANLCSVQTRRAYPKRPASFHGLHRHQSA